MARELILLTTQNNELLEENKKYEELSKEYQEMDTKYNALLQVDGRDHHFTLYLSEI